MPHKGTAALLFFTDLSDEKFEGQFGCWLKNECLPKALDTPGVLDGGRYVAVKGRPKYLTLFEIENIDVADAPAFKTCLEALGQFLNSSKMGVNEAIILGQQFYPDQPDQTDRLMAPCLQIGRMSVPANIDHEWNDWYNTKYAPGFLVVPGVIYARRFRVKRGNVQYMTIYEFEHDGVSESDAWKFQRRHSSMDTPRMREASEMASGSPGIYRRVED